MKRRSGLLASAMVLSIFWVSLPARATTPSFGSATNFNVGVDPTYIAVADFNGDGKPDMAVPNQNDNTVSILLSNGDGTFQAAVNYAVGTNPFAIGVGDFNGDGKLDLAVANDGSANLSVLLGKGDGTFQVAVNYALSAFPISVAVGDFNGDGKLDLAVATDRTNISVLLGNGDGTFQVAVNYSAGACPRTVVAADFNGDGKLDLASTDFCAGVGKNSLEILLGNGDGTFQAALGFPAGSSAASIAIGDFNGDGKLDAAVVDFSSGGGVEVLLGKGDGTFLTAVNYAAGATPAAVSAGDLNGDGKVDLAVADFKGNAVNILTGNGDGTFNALVGFATGSAPIFVAVADFDGDGRVDLATPNAGSNNVSVLLSTLASRASTTSMVSSQNPAAVGATVMFTATVAPVTGGTPTGNVQFFDGKTALGSDTLSAGSPFQATFGTSLLTAGTHSIHAIYSGDANFATSDSGPLAISTGMGPISIGVGDFNGDGNPDLAVANASDGTVSILLGDGTGGGAQAAGSPIAVGGEPDDVAAGDFNGDGKLDLAVLDFRGNTVTILLGDGTGRFTKTGLPISVGAVPREVVVGDFNRDGKLDLAVVNAGSNTVSILLGNGAGGFTAAAGSPVTVGVDPSNVAVGDFNHDGKLDLAVSNACGSDLTCSSAGTVSILLGNGNGTFSNASGSPVTAGDFPGSIAVEDYNADGKLDLAVLNPCGSDLTCTSSLGSVSILLGNGDGTFTPASGSPVTAGVGAFPEIVVAGDLNHDGKLDLAMVNVCGSDLTCTFPSPGSVSTLLGNGDGTFAPASNSPFPVGVESRGIAIVDANRDGKLDLVTADTTSGTATLLIGIGDGNFTADLVQTINLVPVVTLAPPSLAFSSQVVGTTSAAQTVTLSNTGGATLTITSVAVTANFGETNACGSSVAANSSCTISVTFMPSAEGALTGTLSITDNASDSPQMVTLTGTGLGPVVALSPSTLTFAGQTVGTTSAAQTVTLSNTGNASLSITSIAFTGANSGDFGLAKTCGSSLAANSSCTISVTFTPTAGGARTGALTITDNAGNSPQMVALSGTGEDFSVAVASGTPSAMTVTAGGAASYTLSVTPQGGFNQAVSLACAGAPSKAACSVSPASVTLNGSSPASVTVSVTTTASTLAPPAPRAPQGNPLPPISGEWPAAVWLGALALWGAAAKGFRRNPACAMGRPRRVLVMPLAALLLAVALWASCGGGGGNVSVTHTLGTPAGTSTLTITGTSGSLSHSATVTLTVN